MKKVLLCIILCMVLFTGCSTLDIDKKSRDLSNYYIDIDLDFENKSVSIKEKLDYINNSDTILNKLCFHLYPNAFSSRDLRVLPVSEFNLDKAYPNGFSPGSIEILSVKNQNNTLAHELLNEKSILSVELGEELYPTERIEIIIEGIITIPNVKHRFGYAEDTLNLCNFYPIVCVYEGGEYVCDRYCSNGDPFYSEVSNYKVQIHYPDSLKMGATGNLVEYRSEKGFVSACYEAKVVRDFGMCFSEKFEVLETSCNGVDFTYLYYDDPFAEESLQAMVDAVNTFSNLLGQYPYTTMTAVKADFIYGGMEYPNFIIISDDVNSKVDYLNVIIHEVGHQWFYGVVGNNEYREAWLDEGLTEYITAVFYDLNPSYGLTYKDVVSNALSAYLLFVDVYEDVFGERFNTSMNRDLLSYNSEPEYTYLIYVKGVLLLDNLRDIVGDSGFFLGLKNYYECNKFGIATTDHFILAMENATNRDLSGVIQSWLDGNVVIEN